MAGTRRSEKTAGVARNGPAGRNRGKTQRVPYCLGGCGGCGPYDSGQPLDGRELVVAGTTGDGHGLNFLSPAPGENGGINDGAARPGKSPLAVPTGCR